MIQEEIEKFEAEFLAKFTALAQIDKQHVGTLFNKGQNPLGVLAWFKKKLQAAEKRGEEKILNKILRDLPTEPIRPDEIDFSPKAHNLGKTENRDDYPYCEYAICLDCGESIGLCEEHNAKPENDCNYQKALNEYYEKHRIYHELVERFLNKLALLKENA